MNSLSSCKNQVQLQRELIRNNGCSSLPRWISNIMSLFAEIIIAACFCWISGVQAQSVVQNHPIVRTKLLTFESAKLPANPPAEVAAKVNSSQDILPVETGLKLQQEPFSGSFDQLFYNDSFLKTFFQFSQPGASIEIAEPLRTDLPPSHTRAPPRNQ